LDTRIKLVDLDRALAGAGRTAIVTGYFDPLTAAHARRLREIQSQADRLIAIVLDPPEPLLDSRARAELVAALECVDYVVTGGVDTARTDIFHEELADLKHRSDLIARVRARHGAMAG
jgi:cytidyltransferase-like protein